MQRVCDQLRPDPASEGDGQEMKVFDASAIAELGEELERADGRFPRLAEVVEALGLATSRGDGNSVAQIVSAADYSSVGKDDPNSGSGNVGAMNVGPGNVGDWCVGGGNRASRCNGWFNTVDGINGSFNVEGVDASEVEAALPKWVHAALQDGLGAVDTAWSAEVETRGERAVSDELSRVPGFDKAVFAQAVGREPMRPSLSAVLEVGQDEGYGFVWE